MPLTPAQLAIANLLPPNVDAPDWGAPDAPETAEFDQFLDERFPREKFPEFRHMVDGPNLMQMANRKPGVQIVPHSGRDDPKRKEAQSVPTPRSKLANYRFIIDTRAYWRAAARILARVVAGSKPRPPLLRICEGCGVLFIARRANNRWHVKGCGSRVRMAKMRAERQNYEYQD